MPQVRRVLFAALSTPHRTIPRAWAWMVLLGVLGSIVLVSSAAATPMAEVGPNDNVLSTNGPIPPDGFLSMINVSDDNARCFTRADSNDANSSSIYVTILREACRAPIGRYVVFVTGGDSGSSAEPRQSPGIVAKTQIIKNWLENGAK